MAFFSLLNLVLSAVSVESSPSTLLRFLLSRTHGTDGSLYLIGFRLKHAWRFSSPYQRGSPVAFADLCAEDAVKYCKNPKKLCWPTLHGPMPDPGSRHRLDRRGVPERPIIR